MTRYVIGPDVAIRLAREEAVIRGDHQLLAPALLRSQVLSLLDEKAALFDAPECPADVHEQFARLRGQLQQ